MSDMSKANSPAMTRIFGSKDADSERTHFFGQAQGTAASYAIYLESKDSQDECFDMVEAGLQQPAEVLQNIPPENFMTATRQRAWDGIDLLSLAYSASHTTTAICARYIPRYWTRRHRLPIPHAR